MTDQRRSTLLAIALLLLLFGGGAVLAFSQILDRPLPLVPGGNRVAVVPVEGVITSETAPVRALRRLREEDRVRALVLEIRSPGGTVGASQALHREVRAFREEGRPVVAWIGDVGASGGYYAATEADSVFALPGSITGSIGVIMQFPDARGLLQKAGVQVEIVKSGEHKDAGSPVRALDESDREVFQTLVDDTYGQFLDAVAQGRGLSRDSARTLADGRVYSGERAARIGLIDGTATFPEALDAAGRMAGLGEDPPVLRPDRERRDWVDVLLEGRTGLLAAVAESLLGAGGPAGPSWSSPRLMYLWR